MSWNYCAAIFTLTIMTGLLMPPTVLAQFPMEAPVATSPGARDVSASAPWFESSTAQWVWPEGSVEPPNQYIHAIQDFDLPAETTGPATLAISADTNYAVWVNGQFAGFGQWSNFPDDKTYDVMDVAHLLQAGRNRVCVEAYWQGESSSTYRPGDPGVVFAVELGGEVVVASGPGTLLRPAPNYVSGPVPKVTGQLGFTFEHKGNALDNWRDAAYEPGDDWHAASAAERRALAERPVRPRPVARLLLQDRLPMHILAQGSFRRVRPGASPADAMQTDALAFLPKGEMLENPREHLRPADDDGIRIKPDVFADATGAWLVLDIGYQEAGLLELELDAPAGTVIDVGYGEHLEDMRVRTSVGGRQFAVRHTTPQGAHTFMHPFLRLSGRYLQVHIMPPGGGVTTAPVAVRYAGMRPTPYPVEHRGAFETSDALHNRIWEVSRRTLELCMHEHYEDCPWREQALYAMDARNQALAGYYCFGNYNFAKASIHLLAQGYNEEDGLLELCAPADVAVNIPSFSLAWILMLDDYLLFSGDRDFAREQMPMVSRLLQNAERNSTGSAIATPQGPRMWNFYEWAPGLDGAGVSGRGQEADGQLEAPLNLFYLLALDAAARLADETGGQGAPYRERAAALRKEFAGIFWDKEQRAYRTRINDGGEPHFAELTQALAILADVVPEGELDQLRARLASDDNGMVPCTISHTLYKFEALLTDRDRYAPRVFELIARDWGYMLNQGATSFWETIEGASAFADAGSLCHGWSGVPAWFYGAYILGVKPTAPGFKQHETNPIKNIFSTARGTVPTPGEPIEVSW